MRVLAYTPPARGHLHPVMPPLLALRERGAEVHVRTLSGSVAGVLEAGLHAAPIAPEIERIELDDYRQSSQLKAGRRAYEVWASRAPLEVGDLRAAIAATAPDLLLIDTTTFGARAVAEESGLPWAEARPFLLEDPAPDVPPYGLGLHPRGGPLGRLRDAFLYRVTARFDETVRLPTVNAGRRAAGLRELSSIEAARRRAPLTLFFSAEPFEYARPPIPGVLPVGPCTWDPAEPLDVELDDRPLVLVACSSEFQDDGEIAAAALRGLGESHQVVVTCAGTDPALLPRVEGAVVRRFLPHRPLLDRAAVVVCHGGMGITQKSLSRGVPAVVVPWGRDQLDVAVHVEEAEAGVALPRKRLTPERLARAVAEAAACREGAARVAAGYEATGGAERAADALEDLARAG